MGQFKRDRDLEALADIAAAPEDWSLEIIGRGWPEVPGWEVRDEFVAEDEFEALIAEADVIVIPYERFFQSGVAVRALEQAVPVVAPPSDSILAMLGSDSPWIARGDWAAAVRAALEADSGSVAELAKSLNREASDRWASWLAGKSGQS
jgi:hypothetical protein